MDQKIELVDPSVESLMRERFAVGSSDKLPDFLVIGAARAGTTTLYHYLGRHPGIHLSRLKEPEFFCYDSRFQLGLTWYKSLFKGAAFDKIRGEASTAYTAWPNTEDAAGRIFEFLPRVKLIYLMRHPVERSYSHYCYDMRLGATKTFEEALQQSDKYINASLYMMQISRYLAYFHKSRFCFLTSRDLYDSPKQTLEKLQDFLGLDNVDLLEGGPLSANARGPDDYIKDRTIGRLREFPLVSSLIDIFPASIRAFIFESLKNSPIGRRIGSRYRMPEMREETRMDLLSLFRKPNAELASFLARDLSHWEM